MTEREIETYQIKVYKDQSVELLNLYEELSRSIEKGKPIPANKLKKFFSFFEAPINNELFNRMEALKKMEHQVITYFRPKKKYYFNGKYKVKLLEITPLGKSGAILKSKENVEIDRELSLENAIKMLTALLMFKSAKTVTDKDLFIKHTYRFLNGYLSKIKGKIPITDYAIKVITGYAAVQFKHLKTEEMFDKTPNQKGYYLSHLHSEVRAVLQKKKSLK